MGVISTGNHPKALWPGVHAWFGKSYSEHREEYPDLFEMLTSDMAYEEEVQTTGFGLAPVKTQGGGVSYASDLQGPTARYTHVVYGLGYIVTREEIEDNLYESKSFNRAGALAFSMRQTKENVAANVYNRAGNSSYTGADGLELLSTAHILSGGGTWSNELNPAADLSEAALEDILIQIATTTDDNGLKISLLPKVMLVPPQLMFDAERLLQTIQQPGTANNDVNAVRSMGLIPGGYKVNHYFTDADMWFIRTNSPHGMKFFTRRAIEFTKDNDFDTENAKAKATERYVCGWTDPRGLFGSVGA